MLGRRRLATCRGQPVENKPRQFTEAATLASMLRLDPSLPIMWTSPTSVRLGVQRSVATVDDVDTETAHLLERMRRGVIDQEPAVILGAERAERLRTALEPALLQVRRPRAIVRVTGVSALAKTLRGILQEDGHRLQAKGCELAVPVADWRLPEAERQLLLRREIPHLPVVTGDQRIVIGPLTIPGSSACSRCAMLAADDAWWPSWLPPAADIPAVAIAQAVAAVAVRVNRFASGYIEAGAGATITLTTGELHEEQWEPSEECGCTAACDLVAEHDPRRAANSAQRTGRSSARNREGSRRNLPDDTA